MSQTDTPWVPTEEELKTMQLMMLISRSYSDYYLRNYGKDLGAMIEWLALAIIRLDNNYDLYEKDRRSYMKLRSRLQQRIDEIANPRFKPGELVKYTPDHTEMPCVVVGLPHIDEISRKPAQEILVDGVVRKVMLAKLHSLTRQKRVSPSEAPSLP